MSDPPPNFKQKAHGLVDQLPDTADWQDLAYEASVMQDIEEGLRESDEGRVVSNEEVRRHFGLKD